MDLTIKGLKLDVVDAVAELGLDSGFRNLIAVEDLACISDEDERKKALTARVKGMKAFFDAAVIKRWKRLRLSFLRALLLLLVLRKMETGSAYSNAKKSGDVKGMISAKREAYQHRSEDNPSKKTIFFRRL